MEKHEAWRKLIEWKVPHVTRLLEDPEIPPPMRGSVQDVGSIDCCYGCVAEKTRTESFTRVLTRHPELGECVLWYSYRTCICKLSLEYELLLKSSKYYSNTTNKHLAAITPKVKGMIYYNGDVGNNQGELSPEVIVRTAYDQFLGHMEAFPRIRNLERWVGGLVLEGAEFESVMTLLNVSLGVPELSTVLPEKGLAKLLGTGLNNPAVARAIANYNSLRGGVTNDTHSKST